MERIHKLQTMLQQQPGDAFLQHALALELVKAGDDEAARQRFELLLQQQPDYLGSYYHLGKLLERQQQWQAALDTYTKGMAVAKAAGDRHSHAELEGAFEELADE
ncbi:MAG: hypothetical protein EAY75_16855 [Bacteroidetes bacterium]|nr:MAG: hypothetical protein EAY75_16855 [Bacteroidota bacterium]